MIIRLCVSGVLPTSPQYNRVGSETRCSPPAQALARFPHSVFWWESVSVPVVWYIWCRPREKLTTKTKEVNITYTNRRVQIYIFLFVLTLVFFFFCFK